MDRAIFLDKDGTLLENVPYNVEPRLMRLADRAGEALRLLAPYFRLVVISNQAGVAHGYFPESALAGVERRLKQLLASHGVELNGFYYCPHHPQGQVATYRLACDCRKPQPGMLAKAAADLHVDLTRSWMVGDILDDVEAGRRAGCRAVLIDNGGETEWQLSAERQPHFTASDLYTAAEWILEHSLDIESKRRVGQARLSERRPTSEPCERTRDGGPTLASSLVPPYVCSSSLGADDE
ncbi:MAG TPA: HAD family hydrolase [Pirellulales bacterium]|nr:HAD family hydrolase [Pirellulales bacterium]